METRRSSRLKHKLEDDKESPTKKLKPSKASTKGPKAKKTKIQSPKKKTASPKKKDNKETKSDASDEKIIHESSTLEKGHIYFFYRPKVEHEEAHNLDDVQKLYMVLSPERGKSGGLLGKNRLVVMTAKRLPDAKQHSRFWSFIEATSADISKITAKLEPVDYETKTKGDRHLEGCRPCGSGVYSIIHHIEGKYKSSSHTHIAYVIEVPEVLGEVQKGFQIHKEGSFIVTVKNPKTNQGRGLGPKLRAEYPENIQKLFGTKKFIPAEPTTLLDYEGTELILIGAKDDIVEELGEPAEKLEKKAEEEEEEEEEKYHDHRCNLAEEQVFHTMHMMHKEHPAKPLLTGKWE